MLWGGLGNDKLSSGADVDRLLGENGHDLLEAGAGDDTVYAGYGDDTIDAGSGSDWIDAGGGDDVLDLGEGNGFRLLATQDFGRGDDLMFGRAGNDTLHGGRGNDMLDGGEGDDVVNGGAGDDFLIGGAGADLFQFRSAHGVDIIADFSEDDRLILTRNINGEDIEADTLADRLQDLGDLTFLDLGNGHGVLFLGQDSDAGRSAAIAGRFLLIDATEAGGGHGRRCPMRRPP